MTKTKTTSGQILYSGDMTAELLQSISKLYNAQNILLVHGKHSFISCGASKICDKAFSNYKVTHFSEFTENPKWEDIIIGLNGIKNNRPDLIIGIGGGSSLDVAKTIRFFLGYRGVPSIRSYEKVADLIPLVLVPTTSGTGAESTKFAVVYEEGKKQSLKHDDVLAEVVVLDWHLTNSASDYTTVCTGMDALCQAVESYWSCNSTDESCFFAEKAIKNIWPILNKRDNYSSSSFRKKMLEGANWAGQAINITTTTACHAFSYKITSVLGYPHGRAVAVSLPYFMRLVFTVDDFTCNDKRGAKFVKQQFLKLLEILELNEENFYNKMVEFVCSLFVDYSNGMKPTDNQWMEIVSSVNKERLGNYPVKISDSITINDFYW